MDINTQHKGKCMWNRSIHIWHRYAHIVPSIDMKSFKLIGHKIIMNVMAKYDIHLFIETLHWKF